MKVKENWQNEFDKLYEDLASQDFNGRVAPQLIKELIKEQISLAEKRGLWKALKEAKATQKEIYDSRDEYLAIDRLVDFLEKEIV